jgi:hypothetical protein
MRRTIGFLAATALIACGAWLAWRAQRNWRLDRQIAAAEEQVIRTEASYVNSLKARPDPIEFLPAVSPEYVAYKRNTRVLIDSLQIKKERAERELARVRFTAKESEHRTRVALAVMTITAGLWLGILMIRSTRRAPAASLSSESRAV